MATAYCLKCKCEREVENSRYETARNGVLMVKGTCAVCDWKLSRFLGKAKKEAR
jgi:hypothetical protein